MTTSATSPTTSCAHLHRWFYFYSSLTLLVLMLIGFQLFYLQGRAFPGRPITPPIRTLILLHAGLMTAWILLAVVQPLLIGLKRKRLHLQLGLLGVALAFAIVLSGVWIGIASARVAPLELRVFNLDPREFMAVPVLSILVFGFLVLIGVANRRRPEIHRPVMLMASVSLMGAALARIPGLNTLYAGTLWETLFTAFFMQTILAALLLTAHSLLTKSLDRWFATAFAGLTLAAITISLGAKTHAWQQFAASLIR